MTLADASWTYQAPAEPKIAQLNDIVKVTVSVKSQMTSQGTIDRKKLGHGDLKLTSWIKFYGGNLGENGGTNGQPPYGTPEIRGDIDNQLQAKGNLQTQDKLSFMISCRIVDKRPTAIACWKEPGASATTKRTGNTRSRARSARKTSSRTTRSSATRSPI